MDGSKYITLRGNWLGIVASILILLVLACQHSAWAAETTTYVLTDMQGTVLAKEDAHGQIIARYDYRPYGKQQTGPTTAGPGYTGHVSDPDTGLIYMQARYYDPIGRMLSVDPVGPTPGDVFSFNRYAYAKNNPYRYTDPDGRNATAFVGGLFVETGHFITGQGFNGSNLAGALKDGYNGEGGGVLHAAIQDAGTLSAALGVAGAIKGGAALATRFVANRAIEEGAELAGGASKSLKEQAADLISKNGGRNRVAIETPAQKIEIDLAGKSHGGIETPHVKVSQRNLNAPNQPAYNTKSAQVRSATQEDIDMAKNHLDRD
ncbi:RHS repeat-associated core domain-containing protein [Frateuria sp. STR12]|uniref:RHS repeat-associated core domain-containing protein n=1 Tax=Frateuria hangzhouensis TaxID=2995589 RepID=UPI0022609C15|nr:RHS repeat-associated core domain-containing protein [Frateuria sp. STR12]MCX7512677.1 polymorphic toxin type 24 domain-containing protein [Frateuria sp. STR12]